VEKENQCLINVLLLKTENVTFYVCSVNVKQCYLSLGDIVISFIYCS